MDGGENTLGLETKMVMLALMQPSESKTFSVLCLELGMPCLRSHKEEGLESAFLPGSAVMQRLSVRMSPVGGA